MKNLLIILMLLTSLFSCKKEDKNQSTVKGNITYISSITGGSYAASNATIEMLVNGSHFATTTTDGSGNYVVNNVNDGSVTVNASGTYILLNYLGTGSTTVKGKEQKTVSIVMH